MTKHNIWIVSSTFPNTDEAFSMAHMLVEKNLAACVNITDRVTSVYRWQGGIQREAEVVLTAKTSHEKVRQLVETLAELHSYQLPAVTAWPVQEGFGPFLQWIADETSSV